MTTEHGKTLTLSLTSATLLSVSQATIACAFGILLGSRLDKKNQATVALGLMVVAVATFVPAVGAVVVDLINGPRSGRDPGFTRRSSCINNAVILALGSNDQIS